MTDKLIYSRKSTRSFQNVAVENNIIEEIVKTASQAPSWQNAQPWQVYVATGASLQQIKHQFQTTNQASQPDLTTPNFERRPALAKENIQLWSQAVSEAVGAQGTADPEFVQSRENLFNAPAIVYLTTTVGASEFTIYDLGAFGQTLMLAATAQGVDSIPAYNFIKYPNIVKSALQIPSDQELVIGIALGYADDSKLNRITAPRADVKNILHIID